jgi:folate-binding protein YgfZ
MKAAEAVRLTAGLFRHAGRGLIEVRGADRERWLNGQLTNEVRFELGGLRSGCYAFVLTPIGRIVADVHVLARPDCFWLETDGAAVSPLLARLEKYVIADDVELRDRSAWAGRLGLEGPRAARILAAALGAPLAIQPDSAREVRCASVEAVVAAFGWSGEAAFQWIVPGDGLPAVEAALREAGERLGLVAGDAASLEVLRIEAGLPKFGTELDEEVLPAETGLLERAVSFTKGCYTGQEVVARMESRGRFKHRLVGLAFEADSPPPPGVSVEFAGRSVGAVTSSALSPRVGAIALAYLRKPHDAPGTAVRAQGCHGRVVPLPFVVPQNELHDAPAS